MDETEFTIVNMNGIIVISGITKDGRAGTGAVRITVAILDDNLFFVPVLEEKIRQVFEEYGLELSVACFTDPAELKSDDKNYDLLFTDVVLPGQDGITLSDRLQMAGRIRDVIFVSAHDGEVFRSFGSRPIAFVRKSCMDEDLKRAAVLYLNHLKTLWIVIPEGKKRHLMRLDDIVCVSSQNHYVEFHMLNRENQVIRSKLDQMEEMLKPFGFLRVHVSYLVHIKYIASIDRSRIYLKNMDSCRISMKYKKQVFDTLRERLTEIQNTDEVKN